MWLLLLKPEWEVTCDLTVRPKLGSFQNTLFSLWQMARYNVLEFIDCIAQSAIGCMNNLYLLPFAKQVFLTLCALTTIQLVLEHKIPHNQTLNLKGILDWETNTDVQSQCENLQECCVSTPSMKLYVSIQQRRIE